MCQGLGLTDIPPIVAAALNNSELTFDVSCLFLPYDRTTVSSKQSVGAINSSCAAPFILQDETSFLSHFTPSHPKCCIFLHVLHMLIISVSYFLHFGFLVLHLCFLIFRVESNNKPQFMAVITNVDVM